MADLAVGRPTSCAWRQVEVAVCADGSIRLLVNGRRVDRNDWERALHELRIAGNASALIRAVHDADGLTARALADAEGLALSAASMRLKTAHAIGLLARERCGRNSFRYTLAKTGTEA